MNKHPNIFNKDWNFLRVNYNKEKFVILTPPPNLTGSLHLGHALTFSVQDFFIRREIFLNGKDAYMLPGFDHGGIASEYTAMKAAKNENITFHNTNEKREYISNFCNEAKPKIINQMKMLHLCMDWNKERYTMDDKHKQLVEETFIKLYNMGMIYYGESIVNWDSILKTPLSDLEVEYKKEEATMYTIPYKIENEDEYINICTTRPETIFADMAIAINLEDDRYKHLNGKNVHIPIINKVIPIIFDKRVKIEFGTGILKITPAHSLVDYEIGMDYFKDNKNFIKIIEDDKIVHTNTEYDNMTIEQARKIIGEKLSINKETIIHEVPYSFRSGAKIEHIMQKQWFCKLKKIDHKIEIIPEIWKNSYNNWINNMHDWCISRTTTWGHTLPVYFKGDEYIVSDKKELESDGYTRTNQVLDTWFSSALWPIAYEEFPADLLVTAYDILFFWVVRMVLMCLNVYNEIPFKKVFIHRLVRDGEGKKMSKTTGNVLDPIELINIYGLDAVRYSLLRTVTTNGNINFSEKLIKDAGLFITKLWNLGRYIYLVQEEKENKQEEYIEDEINIYFKEKCNYIIHLCSNINEVHLYIENLYEFVYEVCDWLVEFSKVRVNLFVDLKEIFRKILLLLNPILPCITMELYEQLYQKNIFEVSLKEYTEYSYKSKKPKTPDLFELIHQLRSWKNICNMMIIKCNHYDLIYHMTKVEIQKTNNIIQYKHNYIFSDNYLYFYNINKEIVERKLEDIKSKLDIIYIDNLMPEEIIKERINAQKKLEEEIKKLEYLLCI